MVVSTILQLFKYNLTLRYLNTTNCYIIDIVYINLVGSQQICQILELTIIYYQLSLKLFLLYKLYFV